MTEIEFSLSDEPPGEPDQREEIGGQPPTGCVWFGVAGLVVGLFASVLTLRLSRARSAAAEVPGKLG